MRLDPDDQDLDQGLNLTPLIDVVFLLLIFFLVATTFAREEVEMDLRLPRSESGGAGEAAPRLVIQVTHDGRVLLDRREVTVAALRQKLQAAAERNKDQEVLIRGDARVQFGLVAEALDACLLAKLSRVSVAAQPGAEAR